MRFTAEIDHCIGIISTIAIKFSIFCIMIPLIINPGNKMAAALDQRLHPSVIFNNDTGLVQSQSEIWRVAIVQYKPFIRFRFTNGSVILGNCFLKFVLDFLTNSLHIKFKLLPVAWNVWGKRVDGEWNGAIGMLIKGEADIIPFIPVTPSSYFDIDFSKPLAYTEHGMLVAAPREPSKAFIFLRLCQKQVWIFLIVTMVVLSYILYKFLHLGVKFDTSDKMQETLSSFSSCLWSVFGCLLNQGVPHLPSVSSARVLLAAWGLSVLVFTTTYSANLVAFLASVRKEYIINSLETLGNHESISITIREGCPVLDDFETSPLKLYRRIQQVYLHNPSRFHKLSIEEKPSSVLKDVAVGKTAFIDDINNLMVFKEHPDYKCKVSILQNFFARKNLAVGVRKKSPFLKIINEKIEQMNNMGTLNRKSIYENFLIGILGEEECAIEHQQGNGIHEINLQDLEGPFFLLFLGIAFSFVVFAAEITYYKMKTSCSYNFCENIQR